jgi:hypothetical protein
MIGGIDHAFERWFGVEDTWNKSIVHLQRASKSIDETFEDPITIQLSGHRGRGAFTSLLEVALGIMDDETRIEREFLKLPGDRVYQGGRTSLLA